MPIVDLEPAAHPWPLSMCGERCLLEGLTKRGAVRTSLSQVLYLSTRAHKPGLRAALPRPCPPQGQVTKRQPLRWCSVGGSYSLASTSLLGGSSRPCDSIGHTAAGAREGQQGGTAGGACSRPAGGGHLYMALRKQALSMRRPTSPLHMWHPSACAPPLCICGTSQLPRGASGGTYAAALRAREVLLRVRRHTGRGLAALRAGGARVPHAPVDLRRKERALADVVAPHRHLAQQRLHLMRLELVACVAKGMWHGECTRSGLMSLRGERTRRRLMSWHGECTQCRLM